MVWLKLLGVLLAFVGILILRYFPDIGSYQQPGMLYAGLLVGAAMVVVGIALIIFG